MEKRYICMHCERSYDQAGFCPRCERGELLDLADESERELLASQRRKKRFTRIEWLGWSVLIGVNCALIFGALYLSWFNTWTHQHMVVGTLVISVILTLIYAVFRNSYEKPIEAELSVIDNDPAAVFYDEAPHATEPSLAAEEQTRARPQRHPVREG